MTIPRIMALVILAIFGGGGVVSLFKALLRPHPETGTRSIPIPALGSIGLGVLVFAIAWFGFAFMEPPRGFLSALRDAREAEAFEMLSAELQSEMGGNQRFIGWAGGLRPRRWFFMSGCSSLGIGRSDGYVWLEDGERVDATFHLQKEDGDWVIMGLQFWQLGPTYRVGQPSYLDCSDDDTD